MKFVLGYMTSVYTSVVCEECQQGVWCARNVSRECGMQGMHYCPTPHCSSLPVWGRVPRPYHSPRSQAACVSSAVSVWCLCCDCGRVREGTRGKGIGEKRKREGGKMEVWEEYMQMI